ncbi:single strand DNA binding protein [Bacillus phage Karezi]|uniref:Single-stranded DNA-binding protein n=1 Tax=Bacillus phage Karezi TaxID=2591398 RepID=A0A514AAT3_9CAUD|nr:single strand DNA binding protein [Bacillus phage Karezi]QDH50334.1 ssDNA binding protein [Bacillus phage Karezi]
MMNSVNLTGRFTAQPELRYTPSGTAVLNGIVAVQRNYVNSQTGERDADFIRIQAWKKTAELVADHFDKGDLIGITGRIETSSYDKEDGTRVYTTDVVVEQFTFLEPKKDQNPQPPQRGNTRNNRR